MTTTLSTIYTTTAPSLSGVWIHAPADPEGTEAHYLFGNVGRAEKVEVDGTLLRFVGRVKPVAEFGVGEEVSLALSVVIPWTDDHDDLVEWWRTQIRARRTLLYRDNRSRLLYVSLFGGSITDAKEGSVVSATVTAVDYDEEV